MEALTWIIWIGLALLFAHFGAKNRKIDFWWAVLLCVVTSPLAGMILCWIFSPKKKIEIN